MKNIILLAYGEMGHPAVEGLHQHFNIMTVVIPPKGPNRFQTIASKRVYDFAKKNKLKLHFDGGLKILHQLIDKKSPDCVVICSYDKVIPAQTLKLSTFINVHHSDLPAYRGRANFNWAIINGEKKTAVSIHEAVAELDGGSIFEKWHIPIKKNDYISDIYLKVNHKVRNRLPTLVKDLLSKKIRPKHQRGKPTYCCTRLPEDGLINWKDSSRAIRNLIKGISKPFPGAYTFLKTADENEKIVIWKAEYDRDLNIKKRKYVGVIPGRVARIIKEKGVEVLTGNGSLIITEVHYKGQDMRADQVIKSLASTLIEKMVYH